MDLSQDRAPLQTTSLPVSREQSTIPKGDGSLWEYPSPQQMYNAMLRKGYTDTPTDAVEAMVAVHNFLNEGAWAEVVGWEARFARGLRTGWRVCRRGEDNAAALLGSDGALDTEWRTRDVLPPKLVRFTGRPDAPSPKAQLMQILARAAPGFFSPAPPFDRHDWFVRRCSAGVSAADADQTSLCKEIRYVIDYYEAPPEPTGQPVFHLDVRPAADSPRAVAERALRWGGDVWWRANGKNARQERIKEKEKKKQSDKELKELEQMW